MSLQTSLTISGMHCASCTKLIKKTLQKLPDVQNVTVNLATNTATVTSQKELNLKDIAQKISLIGYQLVIDDSQTSDPLLEELTIAKKKLILTWSLSLPLIIFMLFEMFFKMEMLFILNLITIIISSAIIFIPGKKTISQGIKSLFTGNASMDSLIALGTLASLITGPLSLIFPNIPNFAIGGSLVMSFHLTGRFIEAKARGQSSQSIRKLLNLGTKTATIVEMSSKFIVHSSKKVMVNQLKIGYIMLIKPGEKIPADGIIIKGQTSIDQSMVTGESLPVAKKINDQVIGATINIDGLIYVKVQKIGNASFLSQIIKLVEATQNQEMPIQALADKVTSYFVPAILIISLLTFFSWLFLPTLFSPEIAVMANFSKSLMAAIAVLVIACPCALGLATPTALMVATGIGAENGILIKNGVALEIMKKVKTIIFDKTGTLTLGKPVITKITNSSISPISPLSPINPTNHLLQLAASAETASEHPIAQAIVNHAKEKNLKLLPISDFKNYPGQGIQATINHQPIKIGTLKFLDLPNLGNLPNSPNNAIYVSISQKYAGSIEISDAIKPESPKVISDLKQMGFNIFLLTGDHQKTALEIAKSIGIDEKNVFAEILPHQKLDIVKKLQNKDSLVAFVGDGINDAPALSQADCGIAISSGTDIAIESADIVLVNKNLLTLVKAIKLSQKTFQKIETNLFWAFFYNVLAIPIAAMGLLHPIIAEIGMAFSSISVVVNANLLKNDFRKMT